MMTRSIRSIRSKPGAMFGHCLTSSSMEQVNLRFSRMKIYLCP